MKSQQTPPAADTLRQDVRVVLEAECSRCGPLSQEEEAESIFQAATEHTAATGHVVILNGTVDLPQLDEFASS